MQTTASRYHFMDTFSSYSLLSPPHHEERPIMSNSPHTGRWITRNWRTRHASNWDVRCRLSHSKWVSGEWNIFSSLPQLSFGRLMNRRWQINYKGEFKWTQSWWCRPASVPGTEEMGHCARRYWKLWNGVSGNASHLNIIQISSQSQPSASERPSIKTRITNEYCPDEMDPCGCPLTCPQRAIARYLVESKELGKTSSQGGSGGGGGVFQVDFHGAGDWPAIPFGAVHVLTMQ